MAAAGLGSSSDEDSEVDEFNTPGANALHQRSRDSRDQILVDDDLWSRDQMNAEFKKSESKDQSDDDTNEFASKGQSDQSSSEDESEVDEAEMELQDIPFGELIEMKRNGFSNFKDQSSNQGFNRKSKHVKAARKNKHRPLEVTSKKPVSRHREVVKPMRSKSRDPRFDHQSGTYNDVNFAKSYEFLGDYRKGEIDDLTKQMKKVKDFTKKKKLQQERSRLESQGSTLAQKVKKVERKAELKKIERNLVPPRTAPRRHPYSIALPIDAPRYFHVWGKCG
jgi:ribosomal RNA-processing protein 36